MPPPSQKKKNNKPNNNKTNKTVHGEAFSYEEQQRKKFPELQTHGNQKWKIDSVIQTISLPVQDNSLWHRLVLSPK